MPRSHQSGSPGRAIAQGYPIGEAMRSLAKATNRDITAENKQFSEFFGRKSSVNGVQEVASSNLASPIGVSGLRSDQPGDRTSLHRVGQDVVGRLRPATGSNRVPYPQAGVLAYFMPPMPYGSRWHAVSNWYTVRTARTMAASRIRSWRSPASLYTLAKRWHMRPSRCRLATSATTLA